MKIKYLNITLLFGMIALLIACETEKKPTASKPMESKIETPSRPKRWVRVFDNVIIGDDDNPAEGQFFNTRTGAVVKLQESAGVRTQLSLLYSVMGSAAYLTAPANLTEVAPHKTHDPNAEPIFNSP
ncbi:MAG: hypothetical protein H7Y04_11420, partial [Verrucomicrobia bacterium]|nr:hypothetical protein [Cytophagales bacterium]